MSTNRWVGDREEDTCTQRDRRDSEIEGDKERYRDRNTDKKAGAQSQRKRLEMGTKK